MSVLSCLSVVYKESYHKGLTKSTYYFNRLLLALSLQYPCSILAVSILLGTFVKIASLFWSALLFRFFPGGK
jgi:hypothetical protein